MIQWKRIPCSDWICGLVCAYSISTLTQTIWPFSMNRIITAGIVFFLLLNIVKELRRKDVLLLLYLAGCFIYTMVISEKKSVNLNDFIYFATAILFFINFSKRESWKTYILSFQKYQNYLRYIVLINLLIVIISILLPQCYGSNWGGNKYLYGFTNSAHAMSAGCCLSLAMTMLYASNKRFSFLYLGIMGVFTFAVLQTGARVFFVPAVLIVFFYLRNSIRTPKLKKAIYVFGGLAFVVLLFKTGIITKFIYTIQDPYGNSESLLESFTSGRSKFWMVDLKDYFASGLLYQLLGHSFDYIYALNLREVGMEIWAHNDFINILVSCGLLGLVVYLLSIVKVLKVSCRKMDLINMGIIVLYMIFPAFINGFYSYFHFMCSFFVFVLAAKRMKTKRKKQKNIQDLPMTEERMALLKELAMREDISVVIITYNMCDKLKTALDSLKNQTCKAFEVIVVDNHSTDGTEEFVRQYEGLDLRYCKVHNNGILSISRNKGISMAKGSWIAFLDADDYWMPTKIEELYRSIDENKDQDDIAAIVHDCNMIDVSTGEVWHINCNVRTANLQKQLILKVNPFCLTGTTINKEKALLAGGFNEDDRIKTVEDYELWIRLAGVGRFLHINKELGTITLHEGNYSKKADIQVAALRYVKMKYLNEEDRAFTEEEMKSALTLLDEKSMRMLQKNGFFSNSIVIFKSALYYKRITLKMLVIYLLALFRVKY